MMDALKRWLTGADSFESLQAEAVGIQLRCLVDESKKISDKTRQLIADPTTDTRALQTIHNLSVYLENRGRDEGFIP